jgi:hypothetical protein
MKRWSSAKYYREHEGRPVDQGGRVKGCFVKKPGVVETARYEANKCTFHCNIGEYSLGKYFQLMKLTLLVMLNCGLFRANVEYLFIQALCLDPWSKQGLIEI